MNAKLAEEVKTFMAGKVLTETPCHEVYHAINCKLPPLQFEAVFREVVVAMNKPKPEKKTE